MDIQSLLPKQHCGVYRAPFEAVIALMPDLCNVFCSAPIQCFDHVWDVKVHMLMPGQYPCIPNWHTDMVRRGDDGKKIPGSEQPDEKMFLWLSGQPFTEFSDGREIVAQKWHPFTQMDKHRGTASAEHCWRMFIRTVPRSILDPADPKLWVRRHSQVYLDADNFQW